jgi:transposase-like protein
VYAGVDNQRYRCKICNRVQIGKDNRKKYGEEEERKMALKLYLEGYGFRMIARPWPRNIGMPQVFQTILIGAVL